MRTIEQSKLLRLAGFILLGGLVMQLITFIWFHPITFMLHLTLGGLTTLIGVVLYLMHLVHHK